MASKYVSKAQDKRKADKDYRKVMTSRQAYAMENARLLASEGSASPMHGKKSVQYNNADQLVGGKIEGSEVDASFAADIQKMKFCRKPVGFLMWLLYIVLIVALAAPFVLPMVQSSLPIDVGQYVSLCMETEPKAKENSEANEPADSEGEDENEDEDSSAENASAYNVLAADDDAAAESDGEEESEESADPAGEESASAEFNGTLYNLSDPLFGWIKFIAGKFGLSLELGESPWYDTQISKTEVGMADPIAPIVIMVYPPFIVIYALLTLVLMLQTLICFASNDRRIFRFTGIENLILFLCGAIIMFGCFASTTEVDAAMDFSGIVNFLIGGVTQAGGFTAGYGMLAMLGMPLIEFILSFFLLERKLRGREITQPIVVYHYKEK
ncbi:MAG: hypothetical protein J5781_02955 [Clostridia bacterium]|nr:hypothetical protein [Clostridia bacterium]